MSGYPYEIIRDLLDVGAFAVAWRGFTDAERDEIEEILREGIDRASSQAVRESLLRVATEITLQVGCRPREIGESVIVKHGTSLLPGECVRQDDHECSLEEA